MKVAVYTCITGGYDELKVPQVVDERLDYFCFTDDPHSVNSPWQYRAIDLPQLSAKDQNRYIKMHPHEFLPEYAITIYVDGSIQIVGDLHELVCSTLVRAEEIFLYDHPVRKCIYAEAAACAHFSHDWIWNIAAQMRRYSIQGYPVDNGLFEAGIIFRENTEPIRELMGKWWLEYLMGAKRDQLSLPYVAWQTNICLGALGSSDLRFEQNYFRYIARSHRRKIHLIIRKYVNVVVALCCSYEKLFNLSTSINRK